ncbi:MAG: hypothetical protein JWN48_505 [Myxococcaceae bacterium]|nr:hypothetical protein [Myxococcaceae bacterium]
MLQNLTYAYLVAWIVGGLILTTALLLRPERKALWLSFGLIGFGATGFVSLGLGLGSWNLTLLYGVCAGMLAGLLGYGVSRLGAAQPS